MAVIEKIAAFSVPLVIGIASLFLLFGKRGGFESFKEGAREGLSVSFGLIPSLVAIIVGVKMLAASGVLDAVGDFLEPITVRLGIPSELLTLLITRPFSGSASMASFSELMKTSGADSFPAFCASVIMGSSDTIVYILGIYFSSVGVTKTKYAFPCAFAVMIFCVFFCCFVSRLLWKAA